MSKNPKLITNNLYKKKNIKLSQILNDYLMGESKSRIAKKYGVSVNNIEIRLSPILKILHTYTPEQLESYREKKADLIDAVQLQILSEMANHEKIRRANLRDLSQAFEKLHVAGRLERNQSTENVSMKQESFVSIVKDLISDGSVEQI